MKRSIICAALFLVLLAGVPLLNAQSSLPVLSSAVGWWAGDGDTTDRLGNNNGTFVGPANYAPGMVGEAFSLNGTSCYISIPDAPDLDMTSQMTVEAWIYPYGHVGPYDPVIKKSGPGQVDGFAFEFGGNVIILYVFVGGWAGVAGTAIPNNQWSHVAGTYDGHQIKIYVNGQLVGSGFVTGAIVPSSNPLFLGADPSNPDRHFYGLIDEATLYSTALSAADIQSIYLAGSAGKGSSFRFITPATISAQTNAPLTNSLQAVGGSPPYQWSLTEGRLPNGVTLSTSGSLQGTPTETGDFSFGVSVVDAKNATAGGYVTIRVPIPPIPYPVPSGVVAWWPFEDPSASTTVLDRIGNNTGAKVNGPQSVVGEVGQALLFNGSNQYLSFQNTSALQFGNTDFTIEMWTRFDAPGGGSMGEPSHIFIGSSDGPGAANKWIFALGGGYLEYISQGAGGAAFTPLSQFSPTVGQWYHIAFVRGSNTFTTYVNGNSVGVANNAAPMPNTIAPITIGQAEFIGFFTGAIDEPTIYHRALLLQEIQAIFNAGTAGKTANVTINPAYGGTNGTVTVHFNGIGFEQSATVQLVRSRQTNIVGSPVTVSSNGTTIDATFDLHGQSPGTCDIVVTNADGTGFTLPASFTIQPSSGSQLWVNIVGLNLIRPGRPQTFHIYYGNTGNVDALGVPLWIAVIPTNATLQLGFEVLPPMPIGATPIDLSQISSSFDTSNGIVVPLRIPVIPPGYVGALPITITIPYSETISINTWVNPPLFGSPPSEDTLQCYFAIMDELYQQANPDRDCTLASLSIYHDFLLQLYHNNTASQGIQSPVSLPMDIWKLILQCTQAGTCDACVDTWGEAVPACVACISTLVVNKFNEFMDDWDNLQACANAGYNTGGAIMTISSINSFDPNGLVGPQGVGSMNYISGTGPLGYSISFENDPTASAPAQDVYVTDVLDPYKVNINSVQFGDIHFGTNIISVPTGVTSFSTIVDLRTNQNLLVAVDCTLDPNANTLNWHFSSLDPDTMQTPDGPTVGFLPPDATPPEGEGSICFSVLPRNSIATGTIITNSATITFDYNPPINTIVWTNAFDFSNPTIRVQPLSPLQVSDAFSLNWGSADTGSGVDHVSIDVSTNGTDYSSCLVTTSTVSTVFTGQVGPAYWFRVTAWDKVGHSNQTYVATDNSVLSTKIDPITTNYMAWAQEYFGTLATNVSIESDLWGLAANPSGVGSPNFFKWYYNQSPYLPDDVSYLPRVQFQNGTSTFTMVSRISEPDVIFGAEWTPSLSQPWNVIAIPPSAIITPIDGTFETITWPTSLQSTNQGFYRLRLSLNPF